MWQYVKSHGSYPTTCPCKSDRGNYHEATYQASSASAQAKRRKTASHLRGVNVVGVANNWTLIEMSGPIELPPELQRVADLLSEQPSEVRDLFRYALVLAMIDEEKARVIGTRVEEDRESLTIETVAGDSSGGTTTSIITPAWDCSPPPVYTMGRRKRSSPSGSRPCKRHMQHILNDL